MAFIEALNKLLTEELFKVQDAKELNNPEKVLLTWVKHLYGLVDQVNDTETQMTGMKPKNMIGLKEVPLVNRENYSPEETLPEDGLYHHLLQPGKEQDDQHKKATDRTWSKKTYRLSEVMSSPDNQVMYHLKDGPERVFIKEELMLICEDTELLLDYVQKW